MTVEKRRRRPGCRTGEMFRTRDNPGDRAGRLVRVRRAKGTSRRPAWLCKCDCGNECIRNSEFLRNALKPSCGCADHEIRSAATTSHGQARTGLYRLWNGMKARCSNPNNKKYPLYGGRGIKVCERWNRSFAAFAEDMGPRPAGFSVERIDNNKGYDPGNCVWADRKTQGRNKRTTLFFTLDGVKMAASAWAELLRVTVGFLAHRHALGWSDEEVLTLAPSHDSWRRGVRKRAATTALVVMFVFIYGTAMAQDPEQGLVDATLVGDTSTQPAPVLRPQLVERGRATPTVLGASAAIVGGVGLVVSWAVYSARQSYRLRPRSVVDEHTISAWSTMGAYSFWIGAGSSALLVSAEYLLLPESQDPPFLAWFAGGAGLVVAAIGVGYTVGGTHCSPAATRPGADLYLACSSPFADALAGSMLIWTSLPLMAVPIVFMTRKLFAGAPESLSFDGHSITLHGRF